MRRGAALGAVGAATLAVWLAFPGAAPRASGPLRQEAYVWQRRWDEPVRAAIRDEGPAFDGLVALGAEVRFTSGGAEIVRVPVDRDLVDAVALRIGRTPGPFDDASAEALADLAAELVQEAGRDAGPTELQIDFDAGSAQLGGYARWVRAIRERVAPVPVTITGLPDWLGRSELPALLAETDGWVLQVHGVPPPAAPQVLCDPVRARADVERAAELGVPFRVALPTYAYGLVVDERGERVGIVAETGEQLAPGLRVLPLEADPVDLAALVAGWTSDRPAEMQGIVWFRLPVAGDRRNASWPALRAMMEGRAPEARLVADLDGAAPGLWEIALRNEGEGDARAGADVCIGWSSGPAVAADGYRGYTIETGDGSACFRAASPDRLPPGARRPVGWLRLPPHESPHVLPAAPAAGAGPGVRAVPPGLPAER